MALIRIYYYLDKPKINGRWFEIVEIVTNADIEKKCFKAVDRNFKS